ncbi:calcium/sodium antiporter [bacterium]|nr:calcium/sodium antiporter [bacterium]
MVVFWMVLGLLFLLVGAEVLVRGASKLASSWGISPLIIGLTVVAFGTSSPELAVSLKAVASGQAGLAMGNVVGSNIFNVLFILGISAIIAPLVVSKQLIRLDVPLMIAASVLVFFFAQDGAFGQIEGGILFSALIIYLVYLVVQGRKESKVDAKEVSLNADTPGPSESPKRENPKRETPKEETHWAINVGMVLIGLLLLVQGSNWLVEGAVFIAQAFGVSEVVIGLTIVAAGTSLPEVVTSVMASIKGERDIAVGNVVGSNLFNLLGVLGLSSLLAPGGIPLTESFIGFDLPVMAVVAFACLPIFFSGGVISRWEGLVLFGYYVVYTVYLILATSHHDSLPLLSKTLFYFAIPITLITLVALAFRSKEPELG